MLLLFGLALLGLFAFRAPEAFKALGKMVLVGVVVWGVSLFAILSRMEYLDFQRNQAADTAHAAECLAHPPSLNDEVDRFVCGPPPVIAVAPPRAATD
jgi:hypothetical protein